MSDPRERFQPSELDLGQEPETAGLLATARDLEAYADIGLALPSAGFGDRVMAAIASEPMPRPSAVSGFVAMVRDAWAIAFTGGRPFAARAQAFALLLLVAIAAGSVGSVAVVGASRILTPDASPAPVVQPAPSPSPTRSPSTSVSPSPAPSPLPTPTATASLRASPTGTDEPSGTDDHGGSGGSGSGSGGGSGDGDGGGGGDETPEPTDDHGGDETPEPTGDSSGPGSGSGSEPEETPSPTGD